MASVPTSAMTGIPISSSGGQNVYQMMTLETTSGTVHLPVDVQAASRVADEKRRRNTVASANFRQRRKEKEKEASATIPRLEQQVKELSEDSDFYRRERDIFQGILSTIPGCERHLQRPPSPRLRRSGHISVVGQLDGQYPQMGYSGGFGSKERCLSVHCGVSLEVEQQELLVSCIAALTVFQCRIARTISTSVVFLCMKL